MKHAHAEVPTFSHLLGKAIYKVEIHSQAMPSYKVFVLSKVV